jgi:hypothetical protein
MVITFLRKCYKTDRSVKLHQDKRNKYLVWLIWQALLLFLLFIFQFHQHLCRFISINTVHSSFRDISTFGDNQGPEPWISFIERIIKATLSFYCFVLECYSCDNSTNVYLLKSKQSFEFVLKRYPRDNIHQCSFMCLSDFALFAITHHSHLNVPPLFKICFLLDFFA